MRSLETQHNAPRQDPDGNLKTPSDRELINNIIKHIDFGLISNLFKKLHVVTGATRSMIFGPASINVLDSFEHYMEMGSVTARTVAFARDGEVYINAAALSNIFKKETAVRVALEVLIILIHEGLHLESASDNTLDTEDHSGTFNLKRFGLHSVLIHQHEKSTDLYDNARALNEGLTQLLALRLSDHYLRAKGQAGLLDHVGTEVEQSTAKNTYGREQLLVLLLIQIIAKRRGVPEDVVAQELIHSYFNHDKTLTQDVYAFLNEIAPDTNTMTPEEARLVQLLLSKSKFSTVGGWEHHISDPTFFDNPRLQTALRRAKRDRDSWARTEDAISRAISRATTMR